jgi:hypothetical protein
MIFVPGTFSQPVQILAMVAAMFVLTQTDLLRFVVQKQLNRAGGALHVIDGRSKYRATVEPVQQWFVLSLCKCRTRCLSANAHRVPSA